MQYGFVVWNSFDDDNNNLFNDPFIQVDLGKPVPEKKTYIHSQFVLVHNRIF